MRRILFCFVAAIAASLLWALILSSTVFAADATWKSVNSINYDGNIYAGPANEATVKNLGLAEGSQAYTSVDESPTETSEPETVRKIHVIYFESADTISVATSAKYKTLEYLGPASFINPSTATNVAIGQQSAVSSKGTSSCDLTVAPGISWIICPVTKFLANGVDWIFGEVSKFLIVRPVANNPDTALFRAWSYMRSFANVAFVIAFLIIIYSQLTSLGVSNYGIKKLLPRLIIAALLVNLSYYICAIAVDVSNILGYSIQDTFINIRNSLVGAEGNTWQLGGFSSITGFILSGGTAATIGVVGVVTTISTYGIAGSIFLLLPVLVSGLFAVLVALLVMSARQALITILIVISPLAFVAYLLPNTEKWFEKWGSTFMTMLILFPAFSVVFGGSQLASAAIIQNADSINIVILGLMVQVAPLMITPLLIKLGGPILGKVAGLVSSPNKGLIERARKFTEDRSQNIAARRLGTTARPDLIGAAQRNAQRRDHNRRKREGLKGVYTGRADARWANSRDFSNIDQMAREAGDYKAVGEGRSELRYNSRKTVAGRVQDLDAQLRENKERLANVETNADNIYKSSAAHQALHESAYRLDTEKNRIEQTLDRNLKNRIRSSPDMLEREMEVRVLTDEVATAKGHLDKIHEELRAGVINVGPLSELNDRAKTTVRDFAIISIANSRAKKKQQRVLADSLIANTDTIETYNTQTNAVERQLVADFAGSLNGTDQIKGPKRVRANATSVVTSAIMEEIKEVRESPDIPAGERGTIEIANRMHNAIAEGDTVAIRAYVDLLAASGNPGISTLRSLLPDIETGLVGENLQDVKNYVNASGPVNSSAEDIGTWSREDRTIADISADPETWNNLSAEAIAGMKASSQILAIQSGGISQKTAKELLDNPDINGNIKPKVQIELNNFLGRPNP